MCIRERWKDIFMPILYHIPTSGSTVKTLTWPINTMVFKCGIKNSHFNQQPTAWIVHTFIWLFYPTINSCSILDHVLQIGGQVYTPSTSIFVLWFFSREKRQKKASFSKVSSNHSLNKINSINQWSCLCHSQSLFSTFLTFNCVYAI